jgi:hypothetical protein
MINPFHKISIDFEYLNEIYTINSDPYNTLNELKEIVSKKIFPYPGDVHCFFKNKDLYNNEDEQIVKIFPHNNKIKIKLKCPPKDKNTFNTLHPYSKRNNQPKLLLLSQSLSNTKAEEISPEQKNQNIRKSNLKTLKSLPSITSTGTKSKADSNISNAENNFEEGLKENIKNNELFYLLHKKEIMNERKLTLKTSRNVIKEKGDYIITKYKNSKNNKFLTEKKDIKEIDYLLSSLKGKSINRLQFDNKINLKSSKDKTIVKKDKKIIRLKRLASSSEGEEDKTSELEVSQENNTTNNNKDSNKDANKDNNSDNNNNDNINDKEKEENSNPINKPQESLTKDHYDENYNCPSCNSEIIIAYCTICEEFKCKTCLESCKNNGHDDIKIDLDKDSLSNIINYGKEFENKLDKNLEETLKYDKEMNVYDIKKFRDNLFEYINELINTYNQIISILEKIYKQYKIEKAMNKYNSECNKCKDEINEIIKSAKSYLKSDSDKKKPNFKIMNMKYFFNLINEQEKSHNISTEKMKVYSLNFNINLNIEKSFNEIENIMKELCNKENSFFLKEDLKNEYEKLIQNNREMKDKRRMNSRRKTVSSRPHNFPIFSPVHKEKTEADANT